MEPPSSRLCSGPLSAAAQKILTVLRAQSLHAARQNRGYSNYYRQMEGCYGSQRVPWAQSSWSMSQEERKDRNTNRPQVCTSYYDPSIQRQSSQTLAYYQYSQTPDSSMSSCSSSCWNSSLQRHKSQTEGYYPHSLMDSHRKYTETPAHQSSQTVSFTEHEVSETAASFSHGDRRTLSLHPLPIKRLSDQAILWRNSTEEIRPSVIPSLSPDIKGPTEMFPTVEHSSNCKEEPALAQHSFSSWLKITLKKNNGTSGVQKEEKSAAYWNIPRNEVEDSVVSDSRSKWIRPLSDHIEGKEDRGIPSQQSNSETVKTGVMHLCLSSFVKKQDKSCDANSPERIRNLVGQEGVELIVDTENMTESGIGHMTCAEQEMQVGTNPDTGEEMDTFLPSEKRSTSEGKGVLFLETKEGTNLESSLCLVTISSMDQKFECNNGGAKLEEKEVDHCTASECEIKDVELDSENIMVSAACHSGSLSKISPSVVKGGHRDSLCQAENPQVSTQTSEKGPTGGTLVQYEPTKLVLGDTTPYNSEGTMVENEMELEPESRTKADKDRGTKDIMKTEQPHSSEFQLRGRWCKTEYRELKDSSGEPRESGKDRDNSMMCPVDSEDVIADNCRSTRLVFKAPSLCGNQENPVNAQTANGSIRGSSSSVALAPSSIFAFGNNSSSEQDFTSTAIKPREKLENGHLPTSQSQSHNPLLVPSFPLKRKHEILQDQNENHPHKIHLIRHPIKWELPHSSQEKTGQREVSEWQTAKSKISIPEHPAVPSEPQTTVVVEVHTEPYVPKKTQQRQCKFKERGRNTSKQSPSSVTCKSQKHKRAKCRPDQATNVTHTSYEWDNTGEPQPQSTCGYLTADLMSDHRIKDSGKLNPDEKMQLLEEAGQAKALVLTMVYQDGTTQLDPEQKLRPPVCGFLILIKNDMDCSMPEGLLGPNDSLVYLKLEKKGEAETLYQACKDVMLQVFSRSQPVVCYKAKDFLCTALMFYKQDLNWKEVAACHIQDPQVSGWLLDPADPSSCYQDLLNKHCKRPHKTPALGTKKTSQVISGLSLLYWLNIELCSKLQSQGLWELYTGIELNMIPVLAAMESHCIHVDKEALRRMSDLLGTKMKQLEQEAHQAAGQVFLLTSNSQLQMFYGFVDIVDLQYLKVLFEKLRLHEHCKNKKLPKTINKQQQSTSEAALLQLRELHPLPKVILEYRQVHKIKSTFVDGILSCMMSKTHISSTWHQTSVVTGRISAKHPNFQALPRQPLQITKKQYIQGKEEELVTVHPRAMFIPHDGWTFLAADFCQVELRLLAHLSSDPELLCIFTNPEADVFTMLASQWKGVSEGEVTSEDREHAKRIVYSVVYGAGPKRLSGILGVSSEQASHFQNSFLNTYREVQAFIQRTIQQCHKQGYVLSIMGRRRTLPNINSPDWSIRMQAERQAVNFVVQGSAADLCKMAMIRIFNLVSSSSSLSARLIAQLHDELLYEVEDSQVECFAALVKSTMESLQHIHHLGVHLKVPLKVAVSSGKSWGSMSELNIPSTSPILSH